MFSNKQVKKWKKTQTDLMQIHATLILSLSFYSCALCCVALNPDTCVEAVGARHRMPLTRDHICNIQAFTLSSSDELCASVVRSHRETSQYRLEELQALRWKVFCREEIQAYQSKVLPN